MEVSFQRNSKVHYTTLRKRTRGVFNYTLQVSQMRFLEEVINSRMVRSDRSVLKSVLEIRWRHCIVDAEP